FTLENGLTVIVHEDRKAPIVAVSVWYKVGSKDEPDGKTGFAHLFEHLMFNGSENYDDEYFGPFEEVGATAQNGTTWFDRTNYFQNVPTPAVDMAMWMESDRMGHLLGVITEEKLDNQRGVVQNEKRQGDNQPYGLVEYRVLEGLFPAGHPYRHSTIGSMADLDNASLDDVHQWFKDYYGAANAVVVLAGDIDAATGRELAEKYFGDIPAGPPVRRMNTWVPDRSENTFETMYDRVPQIRTYRYWAVPGRITPARRQLDLAASILGNGKNSRLYQALVYKSQLAVSVDVSVEAHQLTSMFSIDVTLKAGSSLDEVNALIDAEMARFLKDGPNAGELLRAQTKYNAARIRGLEQIGGFRGKATALAEGELYAGDPGFYRTSLERINGATTKSVQAAAAEWLSDGRYQLDVLPYGDYSETESTVDRSTGLPGVGGLPDLVFPEIKRAALSNGLEVVVAERKTVPIVNIGLQFDAGYAADSFGKLGTSSFTMSMLDEGTQSRTALEISAEAETLGANISINSNLDMSTVMLSALKGNLKLSVDLFADIVLNPAFSQPEIDRLRQRWIAGIEQEKTQPVSIALRNLPPLIYGADHAYGIPLTGSGTEASINSLTRQDLVDFHRTWIRPSNGTLYVVGDTTMDEVLPVLEKAFGKWREDRSALPKKNLARVELADQGRVIIVDKPGSPQSLILAGHIAPPTGTPDNIAITAMNDIIGGQFTARVNMNLREDKGWAYGAFTFMPDARGQRMWMVYAPVQTDRTGDSIKELLNEFDSYLSDARATHSELDKTVKNNVNSLPGQFETGRAVLGSMLSNQRFDRDDDYVESLSQKYGSLDLGDIHDAADVVIKANRLTWLIVGDREKIESELRALELGPVSIMDADGNIVE
ncbi:MAG: insulinase family protein, partial [Proteobacteria bacterium]|nr:insulinase family protein [Pseudomonadota bacterium]